MAATGFLGDIKGKVVLVTGASSGIGASTAVEFARQGVKVALHGRNKERLMITAKNCQCVGLEEEETFIVTGDITNEKDNEEVVNNVLEKFGTVNFLVNNAGAVALGGLDEHSVADYNFMMQVHAVAPFQFIKLLKPHLVENKGSIVNVASDSAFMPDPQTLGYNVGKAALVMLTKSVALELGPKGVRCNAVSPGWVKTPIIFSCGVAGSAEESEQYIDAQKAKVPVQRVAAPEEVAKAIVFFASNACQSITGTSLAIDGGSSIASFALTGYLEENKE